MNALTESVAADPASRPTPMMAQYLEIKTANPGSLLFYRMGDFYELFFDDAEIASRALGIVLTKRGKHLGEDIPMCGVPIERADDYLHRLIALGHRVAVCEQMEDPAEAKKRGGKSVVRRDVVRLVTPGTITEERLLEPGRANALVAIQRLRVDGKAVYGWASVDISTGAVMLGETDEAGLAPEIARLEPREIVAPQSLCDEAGFARLAAEIRNAANAARARGRRRRSARTARRGVLRRRQPGRVRRLQPRRDRRLRAGARLCRAHPDRPAARSRSPVATRPIRTHGDRRRDAGQSRTDPHARRGTARLASGDPRSDADPCRRQGARRAAGEPADGPRRHQRPARRRSPAGRRGGPAGGPAPAARRGPGFPARPGAAGRGSRRPARSRGARRGMARRARRRGLAAARRAGRTRPHSRRVSAGRRRARRRDRRRAGRRTAARKA